MSNTGSSSEASRQTRLLFQVLDKLPVALFAFRPDGKPAFANRAARELFGKKKLVTAGEFVAHFGLKLASDNEMYPSDKFPLSQVFSANDNDPVSVDDVLLPDSAMPNRRWKIEATPQRTPDGELELVLLFLEPLLGEQLTDNHMEIQALQQELSAKTEALEHLRLDNEQMSEELQRAQAQATVEAEEPAVSEAIADASTDMPIDAPTEDFPTPTADSEAPAELRNAAATQQPEKTQAEREAALRDETLETALDPEEAGHERIVDALDSAAVALDKLELAADGDRQQSLSTQIVALRQQLKDARTEVQLREETIRVQSKELTDKLLQLDDVEAERSQLEVRAQNAESGISILERRLEAVQNNYTEKLTAVEALKKEIAKYEARHEKDSALYEQTQQDYMEQASQLANLRKEVTDRKQELLEMSTKRHDLVAELDTSKRRYVLLEEELKGKNQELRSLRQTLSHAMRATNDAIAEKERLEQRLLSDAKASDSTKTAVITPSSGELAQLNADEARLYEEMQSLEEENRQMHLSLKNLEALVLSLPEELLTDSGVASKKTEAASASQASDELEQREAELLEREELLGTLASLGLEAVQLGAPIQRLTAKLEQHFPATAETLIGLLDRLPKLYRDLSPVFQPQLIAAINTILSAEASDPQQQAAIINAINDQLPSDDAEKCRTKVQERDLQFTLNDNADLFGLRKTPDIIDLLADIQALSRALQHANTNAAQLLQYAELLSLLNGDNALSPLPLNTLIERFEPLVGQAAIQRYDYSALETMPPIARSAAAGLLQIVRLCAQLPEGQTVALKTQETAHHHCVIFQLHALTDSDLAEDMITLAQDFLLGKPHFIKSVQEADGLEVHFCVKQ